MASERAMVVGFCGSISALPVFTAVEIGEQPGRLRAKELHRLFFDQLELDQFVERLLDLGNQRSASHRNHNIVRQPPAQLFRDLEAHGLRSFRVVGPQVHVHESPTPLFGNLRAQAVHLVVVASDAHHIRAENLRAQNLRRLQVGRNKDPGFQTKARRVRCHCVRQVSRGRARNRVEAKSLRLGQSHGHNAVLEAQRRQADGIILDVEILRGGIPITLIASQSS